MHELIDLLGIVGPVGHGNHDHSSQGLANSKANGLSGPWSSVVHHSPYALVLCGVLFHIWEGRVLGRVDDDNDLTRQLNSLSQAAENLLDLSTLVVCRHHD